MAHKHTTDCSECEASFSVTTDSPESVQFCPFCGAGVLSPYDDEDDEELLNPDWDEEFDDDGTSD